MKPYTLAACVAAALTLGLTACNQGNSSGQAAAPASGGSQTASGGASGSDVLLIASGSPLSGGQSNAGKDFANGAALAVDEINAAGGIEVGGKKYTLKLVSEDDAGDPRTGTTVAQKTVDAGNVLAVVGHYNSGVTMVASPIYAQAGIPSITVSTNPDVINKAPKLPDNGTAVFRINAGDDKQGPALAAFAHSKGLKKLAILDDATAYGKGIADQVAKKAQELGVEIAVRESATDKTTDFKALLTKAKAAGADAIMWGGYDDTAATLTKQTRELGMTSTILLSDTACTENYSSLAGKAANGAICSSTTVPLDKLPKGAQYKAAYGKKFPGQAVQAYSPLSYDAVYAVADAVKKAGSTERDKVAAALKSVEVDGLTGKVAFQENGERKDAEISILQENGGKFDVIDLVK